MGKWLSRVKDDLEKKPPASDPSAAATDRQTFFDHLARQLDSQGVARFHSPRLNETIFVVREGDTYLLTLPENALAVSLRELQNMAGQSYTDAELQALAQAKKAILQAQREWLMDKQVQEQPLAGIEAALRLFPGSKLVDMDEPPPAAQGPDKTCFACKGNDFWQQPGGCQACRKCHPEPRQDKQKDASQ